MQHQDTRRKKALVALLIPRYFLHPINVFTCMIPTPPLRLTVNGTPAAWGVRKSSVALEWRTTLLLPLRDAQGLRMSFSSRLRRCKIKRQRFYKQSSWFNHTCKHCNLPKDSHGHNGGKTAYPRCPDMKHKLAASTAYTTSSDLSFPKLFAKFEGKARRSLLPCVSEKTPTSLGFEL